MTSARLLIKKKKVPDSNKYAVKIIWKTGDNFWSTVLTYLIKLCVYLVIVRDSQP